MKINIVRQDTLKFQRAQRIRRINAIISIGSISLFVLSVIYMSGRFVYLGIRTNTLNKSLQTLQQSYVARSTEVAEYLAVKQIVDTVDQIQGKRFKYKEYLDAIAAFLPADAKLSGVDFGQAGVIKVSVRLASLAAYDVLIENINSSKGREGFLFSAVAQSMLSRDKSGSYLVTLELKIK